MRDFNYFLGVRGLSRPAILGVRGLSRTEDDLPCLTCSRLTCSRLGAGRALAHLALNRVPALEQTLVADATWDQARKAVGICRLLGHVSPSPVSAADLIGRDECRRWQDLGLLHDDGWGTAWISEQTDGVKRFRTPDHGADDPRLTAVLDNDRATGRITHLRMATTGMAELVENTHPFLARGIALAHNGSIHPVERLREFVTPVELAEVGGTTDTAIVFALILRRISQGEGLLMATVATVRMLRDVFDHPGMNLLLLTRQEMIVVHATAGTAIPYDHFDTGPLGGRLPLDHEDHYYRMSWQQLPSDAMIVSSSGLEHKGWRLIEQNTAMRLPLTAGSETIVRL
ncbi:class II glutamine amidotransferase [Brevibacterium sp.]|uniref:class II glutamine amidotransferase n=1 Tax=Brevibacterium sp. TaxID=1701 RepID=UPI0028112A25|nr:class II glutamine amidotransferase [Brevibacterium sp.]